jgi:pSer/pThr/pTyr-binding forkhead associated (FHA) protein
VNAQLVCRARPGKTLTFVLAGDESVLGRDPSAGPALPLEGVSRRHARITWDGRFHWLEDLGSTNGTFLNGRRVKRERLRHLDVITLGKKVDLVFALRGEEFRPERTLGIVRAALHTEEGEGETYEVPPGEVTLGRSTACNVVLDSAAVSKVHARLERRPTQLVIEDLGSSNGTFVNGVRTQTTVLHDGDLVLLGGVARLRVQVELGEVTGASGARSRADWLPLPATTANQSRPQFGSEWRTRFEWGSSELAEPAPGGGSAAPPLPARSTAPLAPAAVRVPAAAPPVGPPPPRPAPVPSPPVPPPAEPPVPPLAAPAPAGSAIAQVRLAGGAFDLSIGDVGAHQLGRASESALRVDHPTVSRRHARVILSEDRSTAYVQDLGGANGTWLNGAPVERLAPLREGDLIRVGEVELRVSLRRA